MQLINTGTFIPQYEHLRPLGAAENIKSPKFLEQAVYVNTKSIKMKYIAIAIPFAAADDRFNGGNRTPEKQLGKYRNNIDQILNNHFVFAKKPNLVARMTTRFDAIDARLKTKYARCGEHVSSTNVNLKF